jgi:hypothetical protein
MRNEISVDACSPEQEGLARRLDEPMGVFGGWRSGAVDRARFPQSPAARTRAHPSRQLVPAAGAGALPSSARSTSRFDRVLVVAGIAWLFVPS